MELARVLQNGISFKSKGEPSLDTVCGSLAGHFVVDKFSLSFYQADGEVPLLKIALAVLLAKVCSKTKPAGWDDQQICIVVPEVVEGLGVRVERDGAGETALEDVNRHHVAMLDVSIGRLANLVVGVVKHRQVKHFSAAELAALYDLEIESGRLVAQDIQQRGLDRLGKVREQPAYQRARKLLTE